MSQALAAKPERLRQHDDDTRETLLETAAQRGDAPRRHLAMLTDRIRVDESRAPGSSGENSAAACKMAQLARRLTNRHCHK